MADLVTSILAGAATVTVLAIREAVSWGIGRGRQAPASLPTPTILPPPPIPSQPSGPSIDVAAIAGRVTAIERRLDEIARGEERAQLKREEMAESLTRIETKLDERTRRAGGHSGSTRESST